MSEDVGRGVHDYLSHLTVERGLADGRAVTVSLTADGEALRPVLHEAQCHIGDALGMSEQELHELQSSLHRLADHLATT